MELPYLLPCKIHMLTAKTPPAQVNKSILLFACRQNLPNKAMIYQKFTSILHYSSIKEPLVLSSWEGKTLGHSY
jgi:hypothetical protein